MDKIKVNTAPVEGFKIEAESVSALYSLRVNEGVFYVLDECEHIRDYDTDDRIVLGRYKLAEDQAGLERLYNLAKVNKRFSRYDKTRYKLEKWLDWVEPDMEAVPAEAELIHTFRNGQRLYHELDSTDDFYYIEYEHFEETLVNSVILSEEATADGIHSLNYGVKMAIAEDQEYVAAVDATEQLKALAFPEEKGLLPAQANQIMWHEANQADS